MKILRENTEKKKTMLRLVYEGELSLMEKKPKILDEVEKLEKFIGKCSGMQKHIDIPDDISLRKIREVILKEKYGKEETVRENSIAKGAKALLLDYLKYIELLCFMALYGEDFYKKR